MSLTFALNVTARGLQATENRMTVSAQNITNADKPGYTRKSVTDRYITTNAGSAPIFGQISGATDKYLSKTVINDVSLVGFRNTIAEYLDLYNKHMGATDGASTLASYADALYTNLQAVATSPETSANKAFTISIAQNMANGLRNLSMNVQDQRLQADQKIEETVNTINTSIQRIHELNERVSGSVLNDAALAEYEDQRLYELEQLSQEMDIQYFFDSSNRVQIFTGSGQVILGTTTPHKINYSAATNVNSTTIYPGGFAPLDLDGVDITPLLTTGRLGGLVQVRDVTLVEEQAKLDEFANTLKFEMNAIHNTGTSLPPQAALTGSLQSLTGATAFSGTGTIRVGVLTQDGTVINYADINLAAMTTVNDVITALNAVPNVNASLGANGELVVASTFGGTSGIGINSMTSNVGALNQNFSHYFGLNDMFEGQGAETLDVTAFLQNNNDYLAAGALSTSLTLAAGDRGVARGDGSVADAMADLLIGNVSFNAAGNFAAQTNTLKKYIQAIVSNAASRAQIADQEADTAQVIYQQTKDVLSNKTGVNIDEETAKMVELQTKYQASASVIATIRTCFNALLDAVR